MINRILDWPDTSPILILKDPLQSPYLICLRELMCALDAF
jgi:hypothetical protein